MFKGLRKANPLYFLFLVGMWSGGYRVSVRRSFKYLVIYHVYIYGHNSSNQLVQYLWVAKVYVHISLVSYYRYSLGLYMIW